MVTICHGTNGKFGLKLKSIDTGIFVCFVADGSPAALVGIRWDKVHRFIINQNFQNWK